MDFRNAKELLELCRQTDLSISEIMRQREIEQGETTGEEADCRMAKAYEIMQQSARTPVNTPGRSMGGLIGGEAKRLSEHQKSGKSMCGSLLGKAMMYAMAVLETNSSMGLIVAAPTAPSSAASFTAPMAARGSSALNTALPQTSTSAPAAATKGAVASPMPPSTWMSSSSLPAARAICTTSATFKSDPAM